MDDLELLDDGEVVLHVMDGETVTLEWLDDVSAVELDRDDVTKLHAWLSKWLEKNHA